MEVMLERMYTNCLNFEHTVFLTEPYIEYLLGINGFKIVEKKYFLDDHSIFYSTERIERPLELKLDESLYNHNKKLLLNNDEKVHSEGLWFFSRHPDLFGQLISWWGLYLFALGAYGGEWSIFGPLLATYLYLKKFLVDMEVNLTRKYNGYNEYKSLTPGILPKVSFLKS